jgi:hypothetical protein
MLTWVTCKFPIQQNVKLKKNILFSNHLLFSYKNALQYIHRSCTDNNRTFALAIFLQPPYKYFLDPPLLVGITIFQPTRVRLSTCYVLILYIIWCHFLLESRGFISLRNKITRVLVTYPTKVRFSTSMGGSSSKEVLPVGHQNCMT